MKPTWLLPFSGIWRRVVRCFLAGLLAILPVVVTAAVVIWFVGFLQRYVGPGTFIGNKLSDIGLIVRPNATVPYYVIGWVFVLGVIFILGIAVEFGAKSFLQRLVDRFFQRLPLVGSIYSTSKQVVDMLDKKDDDALKGMSAVYCMFGKESPTVVLAFLASSERYLLHGREYHIVIVPTAPIPFGGALLFVPVESVVPAKMSVDGMMSIYVSMGVSAADHLPRQDGNTAS